MSPCRYECVLVTGAAGFVGRHLLRLLWTHSHRPTRIVATDLNASAIVDADGVMPFDLTDSITVRQMIETIRPDGVIHLAGLANGNDLDAYFSANILACRNILSAVCRLDSPARVMVIGSAAQYGITTGGNEVVDENRPLLGQTPYGLSKTLQEKWSLLYAAEKLLPLICVRPFNIMGPGQPARLVPGAFMHQAMAAISGTAAEIHVGNTNSFRDFTDVRDIVSAMWALMLAGKDADGQVFNIASGEPTRIQDLLDACIAMAGQKIPVVRKTDRIKTCDVPSIVGDARKLRAITGWQPTVSWRQSLSDAWHEIRNQSRK